MPPRSKPLKSAKKKPSSCSDTLPRLPSLPSLAAMDKKILSSATRTWRENVFMMGTCPGTYHYKHHTQALASTLATVFDPSFEMSTALPGNGTYQLANKLQPTAVQLLADKSLLDAHLKDHGGDPEAKQSVPKSASSTLAQHGITQSLAKFEEIAEKHHRKDVHKPPTEPESLPRTKNADSESAVPHSITHKETAAQQISSEEALKQQEAKDSHNDSKPDTKQELSVAGDITLSTPATTTNSQDCEENAAHITTKIWADLASISVRKPAPESPPYTPTKASHKRSASTAFNQLESATHDNILLDSGSDYGKPLKSSSSRYSRRRRNRRVVESDTESNVTSPAPKKLKSLKLTATKISVEKKIVKDSKFYSTVESPSIRRIIRIKYTSGKRSVEKNSNQEAELGLGLPLSNGQNTKKNLLESQDTETTETDGACDARQPAVCKAAQQARPVYKEAAVSPGGTLPLESTDRGEQTVPSTADVAPATSHNADDKMQQLGPGITQRPFQLTQPLNSIILGADSAELRETYLRLLHSDRFILLNNVGFIAFLAQHPLLSREFLNYLVLPQNHFGIDYVDADGDPVSQDLLYIDYTALPSDAVLGPETWFAYRWAVLNNPYWLIGMCVREDCMRSFWAEMSDAGGLGVLHRQKGCLSANARLWANFERRLKAGIADTLLMADYERRGGVVAVNEDAENLPDERLVYERASVGSHVCPF